MSGLDTGPLKDMAIAYLDLRQVTSLYQNEMLDELVEMFADFDVRFAQYPLLAAETIARCVEQARIDHQAVKSALEVLATVDQLKGRR